MFTTCWAAELHTQLYRFVLDVIEMILKVNIKMYKQHELHHKPAETASEPNPVRVIANNI